MQRGHDGEKEEQSKEREWRLKWKKEIVCCPKIGSKLPAPYHAFLRGRDEKEHLCPTFPC